MGRREIGIELRRRAAAVQCGLHTLQLAEYDAEIVVGFDEVRFYGNSAFVICQRGLQLPGGLQYRPPVQKRPCVVRVDLDRLANEFDGRSGIAALRGNHAEGMQGIELPRVCQQDRVVKIARLLDPTLTMQRAGITESVVQIGRQSRHRHPRHSRCCADPVWTVPAIIGAAVIFRSGDCLTYECPSMRRPPSAGGPRYNCAQHMKTLSVKHSGGVGDIVYSIPALLSLVAEHAIDEVTFLLRLNQQTTYSGWHPLGNTLLNDAFAERLRPLLLAQP